MPRVLIVDDDVNQIMLLRMLLKNTLCTLVNAQSVAEALSIAHEQLPDLVLLDIAMPKVDGLELLHIFRTEPQFALVKVILLSAVPSRVPPEDAASAFRVIAKPFSIEHLEEAINAALGIAL